MTEILRVNLYNKQIGTLTLLPDQRSLFTFDQSYIDDQNRPTISQSFFSVSGELITEVQATRIKVLPFFSNLYQKGQ